ncbi:dipeptidase [Thermophagus xiamenensis]|uniref:Dipeptidase n=1 Tax=Thermophagus xiamenensis TaxID=385682 RepID=A0A1I1WJI7_9BACT|nr:C69 family dipeptidase [Thermophagus xiamenensis]SFD93260.1 Dipeptidase [Thermophagus xiamenensis]
MMKVLYWGFIISLITGITGHSSEALACTNVLVTKNASADGSVMVSYAADSHVLYGELYFWPAQDHPSGAMLDIYEWDTGKYLGQIKQVPHTYQVVGNMNEYQVTIAETTFGGRSELRDTTGILDYGSLMYVTLQRAKSAREAIKIMTSLVEEYGYYSSGESFSIADPNEAWILEMIGKGPNNKGAVWVARKVPEGYISAHANQARITTFPLNDEENCLYSHDVISFAREQGYFNGKNKDFSFADAYAPLDYGAVRFCEARVWSVFRHVNESEADQYEDFIMGRSTERMPLFFKPTKKVSARDIMNIMRDHFEGTPLDMTKDAGAGPFKVPYRWRPLTWKVDSVEYLNERAIATQQTGFSFVAQMRNWLPNPIGGILWFGVDDANSTVYVPMYAGINSAPYEYAEGNGNMLEFSWDAAFWVFNWVSNMAYSRYSYMIEDIRKVQTELEDKFEKMQPAIDQTASTLYKQDPALAREFLTEYSHSQASITVNKWQKLGQFLMVKYLDGNIHPEKDGVFLKNEYGNPHDPIFPGYDKEYYRKVVEDAGDKLKMKPFPPAQD